MEMQSNHASPSNRGCQAKARANRKPVTNARLTGCRGRLRANAKTAPFDVKNHQNFVTLLRRIINAST
jgi:hypothetical protein